MPPQSTTTRDWPFCGDSVLEGLGIPPTPLFYESTATCKQLSDKDIEQAGCTDSDKGFLEGGAMMVVGPCLQLEWVLTSAVEGALVNPSRCFQHVMVEPTARKNDRTPLDDKENGITN